MPERQSAACHFFREALLKHSAILNVQIVGSLADGGDAWSDLDLNVVCDHQSIQEVFDFCWQVANRYRPVLLIEEVFFDQRQIVVIYDNHLHVDLYIGLQKQIPKKNEGVLEAQWIEVFNNAIYTFHELDIALKRCDYLWAQRLASHILADISLVLCAKYAPDKPYLHLKNLQKHLPKSIAQELLLLHHEWGVGNYQHALQHTISFVAKCLYELPLEHQAKLRQKFFEYFATWPERYGSYYLKTQSLDIEAIKVWVLSSECYRIRPIHMGDAAMLLALLNSPGWLKYIGDRKVYTEDEARAYITRIHNMPSAAYWIIETHPEVIASEGECSSAAKHGILTLLQRDHLPLPDIGFALLPESQGKGIAKEVCQLLRVHLQAIDTYRGLLAIVLPENVASQKLLLSLGFKPWGTEVREGETLIRFQSD